MSAASPRVGMFPPPDLLDWDPATTRAFLDQIATAGIDHVCCADHVSLCGSGLRRAAAVRWLATLHPELPIYCALYLLPLRHPVLVARQLADLDRLAPGRLTFGVGVGGEDRHEVEICGVDPATRGRRMDESLAVLRELMTGRPTSHRGEFFDLDAATILPGAAAADPDRCRRPIGRGGSAGRPAGRGLAGHLELAAPVRAGGRAGR